MAELPQNLDDESFDQVLRPCCLKEYFGQDEIKSNFEVFIGAAKQRNEVVDHILLYGAPGLGKTTLANIVAHEMGANLKLVSGPSIEKSGDLAAILSSLEPGDILFIDEIHRLPKVVEEILYEAMEDFKISIVTSHEGRSSSLNIDLVPFTLIGATTKPGELSWALRSRFGIINQLNFYKIEDLTKIIIRTGKIMHTPIEEKAAIEIAKRSRGTPRLANNLYRRVRDFANYQKKDKITLKITNYALEKLNIDQYGLDHVDIHYLQTLVSRFRGGPVGLETLSSAISEESKNIEEVYEPYLLKIGFINRTGRGRVITKEGREHLRKFHTNIS